MGLSLADKSLIQLHDELELSVDYFLNKQTYQGSKFLIGFIALVSVTVI